MTVSAVYDREMLVRVLTYHQRADAQSCSCGWGELGHSFAAHFADAYELALEESSRTPRQRWGTCCPNDPNCEHSFLDNDELTRWMDTPLSDARASALYGA